MHLSCVYALFRTNRAATSKPEEVSKALSEISEFRYAQEKLAKEVGVISKSMAAISSRITRLEDNAVHHSAEQSKLLRQIFLVVSHKDSIHGVG